MAENSVIDIVKAKYLDIQNAFACMDGLRGDVAGASGNIQKLRETSRRIREQYRAHLIRLYQLRCRKRALSQIRATCDILKIITEASPAIDQLLQTSNTSTAIEIIENTERLIAERLGTINTALYHVCDGNHRVDR